MGLLISLLANQVGLIQTAVQTAFIEMLPEVERDEQVIEQGSTLSLTCIEFRYGREIVKETKWTLKQSVYLHRMHIILIIVSILIHFNY